ncbi:MAG: hypothetical protein EZS28_000553 [Streblomastix strix]|uniref:Uncharacterized protein n=1 Tax=Streblomastix strix TaxID=222440 RepID=A0A5J4XBL4_9EUKA|nr:MAG: hypothetical protein EZS28_000553 [Streblomastix strix]
MKHDSFQQSILADVTKLFSQKQLESIMEFATQANAFPLYKAQDVTGGSGYGVVNYWFIFEQGEKYIKKSIVLLSNNYAASSVEDACVIEFAVAPLIPSIVREGYKLFPFSLNLP